MRKRHVNEFLRTELNSGRIAGIGITYDNYSEDSWPDNTTGTRPVHKRRVKLIEPKTKYEETPVKVYRVDPNEIKA